MLGALIQIAGAAIDANQQDVDHILGQVLVQIQLGKIHGIVDLRIQDLHRGGQLLAVLGDVDLVLRILRVMRIFRINNDLVPQLGQGAPLLRCGHHGQYHAQQQEQCKQTLHRIHPAFLLDN